MIVLTVVVIALLIAGLAFYLFWVGTLLTGIATNLETCEESVQQVNRDAALIGPGVEHINRSGGTVAGALPCSTASRSRSCARRPPTRPARRWRSPPRATAAHASSTGWA
ncbi:hypothetical protein ACFQV8_22785 [Pseudonocardia benzenivorans]